MTGFAKTPCPPYYAVIFTSQLHETDAAYDKMAAALAQKVRARQGCLGVESVRGANGYGITVAYFSDHSAIASWKANAEHQEAQRLGKERWYEKYQVRFARVERDYEGP
ncbi:antibiotic biosynthesis monooxygenase [Methylocystis sp. SC2]|uniref:antibiotic biosynthesis monooxygenase family protein n=1 Tax=Methylocystis sp. (strain SC2) TaxID=187303 RepID=UPI00027AEDA4|nr:polysaccharide biosynthesis protein [Methylocystis sp. SC2]CCJ07576.1 Antibiotic biosynthesis monooxygenase [Methylocystis sp. SC2]